MGAQHELAEDRGRCGPFLEMAAEEGAFAEPGAAAGLRGAGAAFAGSLSLADLDPAVSAGCLLQHQESPQSHRECKLWVSQAAVVLPVLGEGEVLIPLLQLSHRLWLPLLHRSSKRPAVCCVKEAVKATSTSQIHSVSVTQRYTLSLQRELALRLLHPVPLKNNSCRCNNFI